MRYLAQRYTMPIKRVGGLLTDIGTEELAHMEIICAMVYQLTKNLTVEEAKTADLTHTISTIPPGSGPRQLRRCRFPPSSSSQRETRSPI